MEKIRKEKHSFIDYFVRNPRRLQRLLLCHVEKSCKAKQGNDLCCPYMAMLPRTVARKFSIGGLCVCAFQQLTKTRLMYSVSCFNFGVLEFCLGAKPSNLKNITKMVTFPPLEKFLRTPMSLTPVKGMTISLGLCLSGSCLLIIYQIKESV